MSTSEQIIAQIYRAQREQMVRVACRIVHERAVAEDLVQEAFVLALRASRATAPAQVRSYIYLALRHRALNWLRGRACEQAYAALPHDGTVEDVDPVEAAETAAEAAGRLAALRAAEAALPPRPRETLALRLAGCSEAECAQQMGISVKAVERNITRARAVLRAQITPTHPAA